MKYQKILPIDIANGVGCRTSIWVSGCQHRCKGCFNEIAWDYNAGEDFTEETINILLSYLKPDYIKGLSILGGEPLDDKNKLDVLSLAKKVKEVYPNKNIWVWTGGIIKTIEELQQYKDLDIIVDGPFIEELYNIKLVFRGSSNQRFIDVKQSLENNKFIFLNY